MGLLLVITFYNPVHRSSRGRIVILVTKCHCGSAFLCITFFPNYIYRKVPIISCPLPPPPTIPYVPPGRSPNSNQTMRTFVLVLPPMTLLMVLAFCVVISTLGACGTKGAVRGGCHQSCRTGHCPN